MKKSLFVIFGVMLVAVLAGCNNGIGVREGYGYAFPGLIYSDGTQGGASEPTFEVLKRPYKHLGRVTGESAQTNVLLLVTLGDASIEKAQNDALMKAKGADALINRNFDVKHMSILGLFTIATLQVSGDAIKYTDAQ